ncbi:Endonuclease/Exonuclease/phosphatase family protein [Tritrichomonas foetus]|uniref:Endonuclease/Exonuclease/phosphatase family protein n=1 Tax=Tritrichomonas foetus TaxID=1144522 RepID=A0A1J4JSK1_9EUKA|nr:Endonuclease/Exonuclease/phosphatase family protein [Tritrichomonas foetus]|eukprot:OHT01400.1 Endonuclease/Exonuclease/phosphatase family protein [Tritrichomonas foetus]
MEIFLNYCSSWLQNAGSLLASHKKLTASINLERNALTLAYLLIKDQSSSIKAIFPLDQYVSCGYIDDHHASLIFQDGPVIALDFGFDSIKDTNIFLTQVTFCSRINKHTMNRFKSINDDFLNQYGYSPQKVKFPPFLLPLTPLAKDPITRKNWISRCNYLNYQFVSSIDFASICFLTWNVEQKAPDDQTHRFIEFIFDKNIDIIVIALEEIDFSARAIVTGTSKMTTSWAQVFKRASETVGYESITASSLGGVFLNILYKKDSKFTINVNVLGNMRLGGAGLTCNKSAISAIITVNQVKIGIGAAHFSAHNEELDQRNSQFSQLIDSFEGHSLQFLVVLGDLNYRIDFPYSETIDKIKNNELDFLLEKDQLTNVLRTHPKISEFDEPKITFKPTFKFDENCNVYDTSPRHRIPSWTDRILIKTVKSVLTIGPAENMIFETDSFDEVCNCAKNLSTTFTEPLPNYPFLPECILYKSYDVQFSDHRPVSAEYRFPIPIIDIEKKKFLQKTIEEKLEEYEKIGTPCIESCEEKIDLKIHEKSVVTITNVSRMIGNWIITEKPKFFEISPIKGTLMPSESVDIQILSTRAFQKDSISINIDDGTPIVLEMSCS